MRRHSRFWAVLSVAFGLMFSSFASAAFAGDIIVDDFKFPSPAVVYTRTLADTTTDTFTDAVAGVLGGEREGMITYAVVDGGIAARRSDVEVGDEGTGIGELAQSTGSNRRTTVQLTYDGIGAAGLGNPGAVDLTDGSLFCLDFLPTTEPFAFQVDLMGPLGAASSFAGSVPGSGMVAVPFTSFVGTVSFAAVSKIVVTLNTTSIFGLDYILDNIRVCTPEPASLALLGTGGVGMMFMAIRRRRQAAKNVA